MERLMLEERINLALVRMVQRGHGNTLHYTNLCAKLEHVKKHSCNSSVNVVQALLCEVSKLIPSTNLNVKGKRIVKVKHIVKGKFNGRN